MSNRLDTLINQTSSDSSDDFEELFDISSIYPQTKPSFEPTTKYLTNVINISFLFDAIDITSNFEEEIRQIIAFPDKPSNPYNYQTFLRIDVCLIPLDELLHHFEYEVTDRICSLVDFCNDYEDPYKRNAF